MDIQTKDGILLRNIPDGTPDDVIKQRIYKIRSGDPTAMKPTMNNAGLSKQKFNVTSPDGQEYEVNAPKGATEQYAIKYVQDNLYQQKATPKEKTYKLTPVDNIPEAKTHKLTAVDESLPDQLIDVPNHGIVSFPGYMSETDIVAAIKRNSMGYKKESTRNWGDVPLESLKNIPSSAKNFISGIGNAVAHPIDTATNISKLALGTAENAGGGIVNKAVGLFNPDLVAFNNKIRTPSNSELMADAAGNFYKQRYGSLDGLKETIANDPVGLLADASTVLTAGGAVASKIPTLSKVGSAMTATSNAINPISMATKATGKVVGSLGNGVSNIVGGLGTHTGAESLKQAYKAGLTGGDTAKAFTDNMRGNVPMTDVLNEARAGLQSMGAEKASAYRAGMAKVSNDKSVLSFNGIDKAVDDAFKIASFKGKATNTKAFEVQQAIADEIKNWKALNPDDFHTPEGLDALKQKIGGIQEAIPFEQKTARAVAGKVYNSIKAEIAKQAPTYSGTMKGYSEASDQISEIEKALSLGGKASVDTAMRKLQSLMRNNVNTNYGNRLDLAKQLEQQGGVSIMPALAGQSLNSWTPRGLGGAVAGATGGAGLVTMNPMVIPALAMQSPRLMGEAALKTGQATGLLGDGVSAVNKTLKAVKVKPKVAANILYQVDKQNKE